MKKRLAAIVLTFSLIVSAIFCFGSITAFADDSGNCGASATALGAAKDNAKYTYSSATKTLTISGTGATKNYGATSSNKRPWDAYKTEITTVVVKEGITELGQLSFYNCTALTKVTLPASLTTIKGGTANYGAFRECTALKSITLPLKLTTIEAMAFRGCTALESIKLPDSVTSLGLNAFSDCTSLRTVTFGNGMTSTGTNAFRDCTALKTIVFSPTITAIDEYSFFNTRITSIEIPEAITKIGTRAFANCEFLSGVTIHNANCTFGGLDSGNGPFDGSNQEMILYGHKGSTTETFANDKGYKFVSIDPCDHASTHEVITIEPTCTEKGETTQVCDECGFVVSTSELPAINHDWVIAETIDKTDEDGHIYKVYACANEGCGEDNVVIEHVSFVDGYFTVTYEGNCTIGYERKSCNIEGCSKVERKLLTDGNHTVAEYTVTLEPTCTEAGSMEGTCTTCEKVIKKTIDPLGHTNIQVDAFDNTEDDGHSYVVYECSVCGEQTVEPTHNEWTEGHFTSTVISEPRCVLDGTRFDKCDICSLTRRVTLPANGEHVWYETARTEPTCTAVGKIYFACENCNLTKSENIKALGHDYVYQEESSLEPTCTAPGYKLNKCTRCSSVDKAVVSAMGHTVDELNYEIEKEPDCVEEGLAHSVCTTCGEPFDITLNALGHNHEPIEEVIEDKPGHVIATYTCTRCGDIDLDKTGTVHKEWLDGYYTHDITVKGSCTIPEVSIDTCKICGDKRTNTAQAQGHKYTFTKMENTGTLVYTCSVCGESETRNPQLVATEFRLYINQAPSDSRLGYRFELNFDGVINAKDYSMIVKAVEKSKAYQ